ncbi:hypothetical protein CRG98_014463 [Punica granatum]|uniref:Uncharacterized protein n=1 Tax=Punica granatum TaxID=22663 RepID=A0A2I0K9C8_PUNGR|nr:hypothetical protein CRG98_014463 [Punica granatum]
MNNHPRPRRLNDRSFKVCSHVVVTSRIRSVQAKEVRDYKVTLLDYPPFQALLDLARDDYRFTASSKLCIPCDESMFIEVVRCAGSPQERRVFLYL